ncbi:cytochrome c biogenesis CcdA family protein [Brevibacillus agri]|uniref:cytochrome c biogenesis CcdA family protein n=1 Tax=Brevibacillus TaxID=55080 RepID=UPI0018CF88E3|nr:sulfite exporter TauE/SafE family protein [Brevibacillus agri]MBG9567127.1 cytochrome c biogenesis protein [Brevibacillus agri]
MWNSLLYQLGSWFSNPFSNLFFAIGEEIPLIGALLLGMIGAFAPCQLSGNVAAFTIFGKKLLSKGTFGRNVALFILGKAFVYSTLGAIVYLFGEHLSNQAIPVFQWARKLLAPLFVVIGLFLLGFIRIPHLGTNTITQKIERFAQRFEERTQAFLLGVAFSLGFCPTMFWLFFGLAMPLMLSSSVGIVLPAVFSLGTAIPLFAVLLILAIVGDRAAVLKRSRKWGTVIQKVSGGIFVLLGISDFFTFW